MNIREMIQRLEEAAEAYGDDAEVRLMTQQHWPFENAIAGVTSLELIQGESDDDFDSEGDADQVVYIVEGQQLGYGSERAWNTCF